MSPTDRDPVLDQVLAPFQKILEPGRMLELSRLFTTNFADLATKSRTQFLPTPISESILRPAGGRQYITGQFLAIDVGGTNLRVGFVELLSPPKTTTTTATTTNSRSSPRLRRLLEQSWPIEEHLKYDAPDHLFAWIGKIIVSVIRTAVEQGLVRVDLHAPPLPMGVTFSFPMEQQSLTQATLMPMGKGFAISPKVDLEDLLVKGYDTARSQEEQEEQEQEEVQSKTKLPDIRVVAITNDAVATLVSLIYLADTDQESLDYHHSTPDTTAAQVNHTPITTTKTTTPPPSPLPKSKAVMALILGTGTNATIPLPLPLLHPSKRPAAAATSSSSFPSPLQDQIAVNTEWSINGTAPPLRYLDLLTPYDDALAAAAESPGFQPLEYMTAGRYLGELVRLIFVDYLRHCAAQVSVVVDEAQLPPALCTRFGLSTTFLGFFKPPSLLDQLRREVPCDPGSEFQWTSGMAAALYYITIAIQRRAAAVIAAAVVALLCYAGEIIGEDGPSTAVEEEELVVGYTGGCISCFQEYLADCQASLDRLVQVEMGRQNAGKRVVLRPCHDGGIMGAGILVPAALASEKREGLGV